MTNIRLPAFFTLLLVVSSMTYAAERYDTDLTQQSQDRSLQVFWDSRYVTEGRDNLDKAGIQSTSINYEHGSFRMQVWNAWGYDSRYDEVNIIPSLNYSYNNIDVYFSFNHKQFFMDNENDYDNEIGSGITYNGLPYNLTLGFDWYHSFGSEGSFFEFSVGSDFNPVESITIEPSITFGINDSYISDGHDGANHISLNIDSDYEITDLVDVHGYVGYNIPIDRDPIIYTGDKLLKTFLLAGIGLVIRF